jgi:hypothetical protein
MRTSDSGDIGMTSSTLPTSFRLRLQFVALAAAAAACLAVTCGSIPARAAAAPAPSTPEADPNTSATGRIGIRLVRLLSEVPEGVEKRGEPLHDLRVELVPGNVLVFRKGAEFAALLPIDHIEGRVDSLRYFFYVEKSPVFWFFGGEKSKGIRTVPDGGGFQFDTFRLLWRHGGDQAGWIYFPDSAENQGLRFSVVSGQSVDDADPKETKYWVELGSEGKAGF